MNKKLLSNNLLSHFYQLSIITNLEKLFMYNYQQTKAKSNEMNILSLLEELDDDPKVNKGPIHYPGEINEEQYNLQSQ